jgi:hypothetical protein
MATREDKVTLVTASVIGRAAPRIKESELRNQNQEVGSRRMRIPGQTSHLD